MQVQHIGLIFGEPIQTWLCEEECVRFLICEGWMQQKPGEKGFAAAKESKLPTLVKFAEQKEKRIDGLIAQTVYPISTGKLDGFNG